MRIAGDRVPVVLVLVAEAIFPRIGAEDLLLLVPGFEIPGERHDARVLHPAHADGLGLLEGVEQIEWNPRVAVDDLLADAHHVHDRENLRLLVETYFLSLVVRP